MHANYLVMGIVAMVQQHVPPHWFFGYRLDEWVAIFTIMSIASGAIVWLVNTAIVKPLRQSIDLLTEKIEVIGENANSVHAEQDHRIDDHEIHLARHDEELKTLFDWKNDTGGKS
ncbi:hypothetical protein [Levilactobacillus sp. HBUAS70063]|uniref:hypothetical protein n=1 Tax=Levilactobacillus sp. HBUAS70063 TaxID=3109359 RepID=UPI003132ACB9